MRPVLLLLPSLLDGDGLLLQLGVRGSGDFHLLPGLVGDGSLLLPGLLGGGLLLQPGLRGGGGFCLLPGGRDPGC
jgi:hypothetical protein